MGLRAHEVDLSEPRDTLADVAQAVAVKLVVASMDTNGAARSCGFASPSAMV